MIPVPEQWQEAWTPWNEVGDDLALLKQCNLNEYQIHLVQRLDEHLAEVAGIYGALLRAWVTASYEDRN
jgi:hypothetical protein